MTVAVVLPNTVILVTGGLPFLGGCLFQSGLEDFLLKALCDLLQIWGRFVNSGLSLCVPSCWLIVEEIRRLKFWFLNLKLNEAGMW